jgi:hypothetical protein
MAMAEPPAPLHVPAVSGIRPPQPPNLEVGCAADNWKMFKQKWNNYAVITKLARQDREYQGALQCHTLGDDALRVFNGFKFTTPDEERTTAEIIAKFDEFAVGEVNETYERFVFNKRDQKSDETFDSFLSSIRLLIKTCNYGEASIDSILRDRIVQDCQKLLLRERKLSLETMH